MDNPCRHVSKVNLGDLVMEILLTGIFGSVIVGFVVYGNDIMKTYGYKSVLLSGFFIAMGFFIIIFDFGNQLGLLSNLSEFIAGTDPNEILSKCEFAKDEEMSKDEKLEKAYSLAMERAYALFVNFFVYWIILGIASGTLIYLGPPHWLTTLSIYAFSLFGFLSFVLWIISYLRYRDYSKRLFAIQLKKSDRAEISIKI